MNIFIREMKANRKSLLVWSIGIFLLIASSMGKYAALSTSGQSINDLLEQMPKSLKAIMGLGTFDLSTITGYYGVLFIYLVVMANIHAAMLGANIISKEERDKTTEFLFVKPISRSSIITSKLAASLINILILNFVTYVSSIVMVQKYSNGEAIFEDITILMIGMLILQLIFLFMGTAIGAISKNPKASTSLTTGILLSTFILSVAIDINSRIENLKYLTPFKYFDDKNLLLDGGFDTVSIALSAVIIPVLFSMTYVFYSKRDLNV